MHRRGHRPACLKALWILFAFALLRLPGSPLAQQKAGAETHPVHPVHPASPIHPLERPSDSYAIYSLLMPGDLLAGMEPSQNQQWAIAQTTVNAQDIDPALAPEAALRAPADHARLFQEAVADYNRRKNQRSTLARDFDLDHPYALLTPAEAEEFRAARGTPGASSALRQKYSGYPGITYFSQVYFDLGGSAALVYMLNWCGNLCAEAQWVYLEKRDDHWTRRSGKILP